MHTSEHSSPRQLAATRWWCLLCSVLPWPPPCADRLLQAGLKCLQFWKAQHHRFKSKPSCAHAVSVQGSWQRPPRGQWGPGSPSPSSAQLLLTATPSPCRGPAVCSMCPALATQRIPSCQACSTQCPAHPNSHRPCRKKAPRGCIPPRQAGQELAPPAVGL